MIGRLSCKVDCDWLQELERQENVMVITHQAVARCLFAYFTDMTQGVLSLLLIINALILLVIQLEL